MKKLSKNIPTTDNQVSKMKPTEIECIKEFNRYDIRGVNIVVVND